MSLELYYIDWNLAILRDGIASVAKSEEDVEAILRKVIQELNQTNWSALIAKKQAESAQQEEKRLNKPSICRRCKQKFKFRELKKIDEAWEFGYYCSACFDHFHKEHTYTCPICNTVYLSQKFSQYCISCRIKDIDKKETRVVQRHLRDAQKAGRPATLKINEWLATLQHFNGYCAYCQKQPYQVLEHFIHLNPGGKDGGGTTADNCVPSCESCNRKKKSIHPDKMLARAISSNITQLSKYNYGISSDAIERVWKY